jgi:ribosomal protein L7/L12
MTRQTKSPAAIRRALIKVLNQQVRELKQEINAAEFSTQIVVAIKEVRSFLPISLSDALKTVSKKNTL